MGNSCSPVSLFTNFPVTGHKSPNSRNVKLLLVEVFKRLPDRISHGRYIYSSPMLMRGSHVARRVSFRGRHKSAIPKNKNKFSASAVMTSLSGILPVGDHIQILEAMEAVLLLRIP